MVEKRVAMHISSETLDDALRNLYPALLASERIVETSRGRTIEILGVLVEIAFPRARLSRSETRGKPFSCLGELLWYLSRENRLDFIRHYVPAYDDESEDGVTVYGGYGPRLFSQRGNDQVQNVLKLLRTKPMSRRAVIQLFDAEDISRDHTEIPCTTTLQFMVRDNRVHMVTTMRSNDAYIGLPHDVFCFTMLQEIVARSLGYELGAYNAKHYVDEAVLPRIEMPHMPPGDPWAAIENMLKAHSLIWKGEVVDADTLGGNSYWADLIRLLQIFASESEDRISELKAAMEFRRYGVYIDNRLRLKQRAQQGGAGTATT